MDVVSVFAKIGSEKEMRRFFEEIFTESERKDISLRWESMKMLSEKVPQRQISKKLGISLCKITRGSKVLKDRHSVSGKILNGSF